MDREKVKLPRRVAEALESARIDYPNEDDFILWKSCQEDGKKDYFKVLQSFTRSRGGAITLARAILNGYEIRPEPIAVTVTVEQQEKLKKYYDHYKIYSKEEAEYFKGAQFGFREALDFIGLKIPGVND